MRVTQVGARSNGGTGIAYILLLDKNGNRINACGCDNEYFEGIATASKPNRMLGNGDVNSLIQAIQGLPKDDPLEFIFVGDSQYLHSLANNPTQAKTPWQPVLRGNLGLP